MTQEARRLSEIRANLKLARRWMGGAVGDFEWLAQRAEDAEQGLEQAKREIADLSARLQRRALRQEEER